MTRYSRFQLDVPQLATPQPPLPSVTEKLDKTERVLKVLGDKSLKAQELFVHLITSNIGFPKVFFNLFFGSTVLSTSAHWSEFWSGITFFSFLGSNLGFWLGVSSYCVVPCLRFLGWR